MKKIIKNIVILVIVLAVTAFFTGCFTLVYSEPDPETTTNDDTNTRDNINNSAGDNSTKSGESEKASSVNESKVDKPTPNKKPKVDKPTSKNPAGSTVNNTGDIVNKAVDGKELWGYIIRLYNNNTRAHFFETKNHRIATAVYDLKNGCWLTGRNKLYAKGLDLTKLYIKVSKSHIELDRLYTAPAEVVETQTIIDNIYLPVLQKLAPNTLFPLDVGVGSVGSRWTVNLYISATGNRPAQTVSFRPSSNIRRTASLSTEGYIPGETVSYYYEIVIPGKKDPFVMGIKGGAPAYTFVVEKTGKPEAQPFIYQFEDPEPFILKYLDIPKITSPVSGKDNTLQVEIKNQFASNWIVSFSFGNPGSKTRKRVVLAKSGKKFIGNYKPSQFAGDQIEYNFSIKIPGSRGGNYSLSRSRPITVVKEGQRSYTADEVLRMVEIPPIRDYPESSHDPNNPRYHDWSGSRPILKMSPEIKRWSFLVFYRKAGSGDNWKPATGERVEVEKNPKHFSDNRDHLRSGALPFYEIKLPGNTYWRGDVIEYYFNIFLYDTGESFDLFKNNPMSYRPTEIEPSNRPADERSGQSNKGK